MKNTSLTRVLITDDSALVREILAEILESDPDIMIVGEAENGQQAVDMVLQLKPDLVTMDLEMPVMDGHAAIEHIMAEHAVPILVISSLDDAFNAYAAVSRGALEVIGKPQLEGLKAEELTRKVKMLAKIQVIKHLKPAHNCSHNPLSDNSVASQTRDSKPFQTGHSHVRRIPSSSSQTPSSRSSALEASTFKERIFQDNSFRESSAQHSIKENHSSSLAAKQIFAIASSTGGPQALETIFKKLPVDFPAPIVVAQHISDGFAGGLVEWLDHNVALGVKLAEEGQLLQAGNVYISPSESHMQITLSRQVRLLAQPSGSIYHPNCDLLLESVAQAYADKAVGIICTGMGNDGVAGMQSLHDKGATTLAQDEQSSVIYGMNQVAIQQQCISQVLSLDALPGRMLLLSGYESR